MRYTEEQIEQAKKHIANLNKYFGYDVEVTDEDAIRYLNTRKKV